MKFTQYDPNKHGKEFPLYEMKTEQVRVRGKKQFLNTIVKSDLTHEEASEIPMYFFVRTDGEEEKEISIIVTKGGEGSGHHGHRGRPGKVGGSLPGKGPGLSRLERRLQIRTIKIDNDFHHQKGESNSYTGTIRDKGQDYRVIVKPNPDDAAAEVAVYVISKELGFTTEDPDVRLVPVTVKKDDLVVYPQAKAHFEEMQREGIDPERLPTDPASVHRRITAENRANMRDEGMVQYWQDNTMVASDYGTEVISLRNPTDIDERTAGQLVILDGVIGNHDRHAGNWLIERGTGKVIAIDHNLAFTNDHGLDDSFLTTRDAVESRLSIGKSQIFPLRFHADDVRALHSFRNKLVSGEMKNILRDAIGYPPGRDQWEAMVVRTEHMLAWFDTHDHLVVDEDEFSYLLYL